MKIPDTITAKVREFRERFDRIATGLGGFIVGEKGSKFDNCASDLGSIEAFLEQALLDIRRETLEEEKESKDGAYRERDILRGLQRRARHDAY